MTAITGSADCPPHRLAATRDGLHRVAEHVLAAARYAASGEIGLIPLERLVRSRPHLPPDRHRAGGDGLLPRRPGPGPGHHPNQEDIMKALQDKVALVTGGSSGIGQTLFIDGGLTLYPSFETTWSSE
jgi:hypothetical protein